MKKRENIIKLFQVDTLLASISGIRLEEYMRKKHGWSKPDYKGYLYLYTCSLIQ